VQPPLLPRHPFGHLLLRHRPPRRLPYALLTAEVYLEIKAIVNPEKKGGTGNFELRSKKGSNSIDENLIFGSIGMGEQQAVLISTTVAFDTAPLSPFAGDSSKYIINFKLVSFIPKGSYFRITPPLIGYSAAATPACSFLPVFGVTPPGTLSCTYLNGVVLVRGLAGDLVSGTVVKISLELINPPSTASSPLWRIEVMRDKTQYIYDWKDKLVGPNILPGKLTGLSLVPTGTLPTLSAGKREIFELTFVTKNPIPLGGMIEVTIPPTMALIDLSSFEKPTTYFVKQGLVAASATEKVSLVYSESNAK
jgi:hypothetical protein